MMRRRTHRHSERATFYKLCSLAPQYPDEEPVAGRVELATAAAELRAGRRPILLCATSPGFRR